MTNSFSSSANFFAKRYPEWDELFNRSPAETTPGISDLADVFAKIYMDARGAQPTDVPSETGDDSDDPLNYEDNQSSDDDVVINPLAACPWNEYYHTRLTWWFAHNPTVDKPSADERRLLDLPKEIMYLASWTRRPHSHIYQSEVICHLHPQKPVTEVIDRKRFCYPIHELDFALDYPLGTWTIDIAILIGRLFAYIEHGVLKYMPLLHEIGSLAPPLPLNTKRNLTRIKAEPLVVTGLMAAYEKYHIHTTNDLLDHFESLTTYRLLFDDPIFEACQIAVIQYQAIDT